MQYSKLPKNVSYSAMQYISADEKELQFHQ